jgi:hypothetical protein
MLINVLKNIGITTCLVIVLLAIVIMGTVTNIACQPRH